jgi:hypothetical protein
VGHARQWRQWSEEACEQDTGSERMRQKETNREKRERGGSTMESADEKSGTIELPGSTPRVVGYCSLRA